MTMIEKVARAICHNDGWYEEHPDKATELAKVVIEAMRSLVQMTLDGNAADHYALQKYINAALKD